MNDTIFKPLTVSDIIDAKKMLETMEKEFILYRWIDSLKDHQLLLPFAEEPIRYGKTVQLAYWDNPK